MHSCNEEGFHRQCADGLNLETEVTELVEKALKILSIWDPRDLRTEHLKEAILEIPEIISSRQQVDRLIAENLEKAHINMSFEPELKKKKEKLWESYDIAQSLDQEFQLLCQKYGKLAKDTSYSTLSTDLEAYIRKRESDSEALASSFVSGSVKIDEFSQQFISVRSNFHELQIKLEKMKQMGFL